MDWESTLAVMATITSFVVQFVGVEMCFRIVRKGSTGDIAPAPFIAFFVSACVWLKYGLMMNIASVILTSVLSAVLQFLYVCIYYVYSTKKHHLHRMILLGLVILFVPLMYVTYYETVAEKATRNLGLYCCGLSILGYASPLATLSEVIRHKSTESISFPLCLVNFIAAIEWTLYGIAINDRYVTLPNAFGGCLGVLQFCLFCIYGLKRRKGRPAVVTTA